MLRARRGARLTVPRGMMTDEPAKLCALTLVMTNLTRAHEIAQACRAAGVSVQAVSSIAQLEQWPVGQIVMTDAAYVTPFWGAVGALEVIAFVDDSEGKEALRNGATGWLPIASGADTVAATILSLGLAKGPAAVRRSE